MDKDIIKKVSIMLGCAVAVLFSVICGILIVMCDKKENKEEKSIEVQYDGRYGIDVSSYQKNIDWKQVKKSGISYAIVRGTAYSHEGQGELNTKLSKDVAFETNYNGAKEENIDVGVYVYSYASNVLEARREAMLVVKYLARRKLDLPIYYDIEAENRKKLNLVNENTQMAVEFCEYIKNKGYKAGVYSSASFLSNYIELHRLRDYDMWAARYIVTDELPFKGDRDRIKEVIKYGFMYGNKYANIRPTIWQFTQSGRVSGIDGYVDINYKY